MDRRSGPIPLSLFSEEEGEPQGQAPVMDLGAPWAPPNLGKALPTGQQEPPQPGNLLCEQAVCDIKLTPPPLLSHNLPNLLHGPLILFWGLAARWKVRASSAMYTPQ